MSELHPNWAECSKIVVVLGKIPDLFLQWVHSPSSYRCLERHECHECGMCRSERDASGTRGGSTSRKTGAMKEGSWGYKARYNGDIMGHIPVVPHKAVAEVSKIGNL